MTDRRSMMEMSREEIQRLIDEVEDRRYLQNQAPYDDIPDGYAGPNA